MSNTVKAVFHGAYDYKQGDSVTMMEVPANTHILVVEKKNRILLYKNMVDIFNILARVSAVFSNDSAWPRIKTVKFNSVGHLCYNIKHFKPDEKIYDQLMDFEYRNEPLLDNALGVYDITRMINPATGIVISAADVNIYTPKIKLFYENYNAKIKAQHSNQKKQMRLSNFITNIRNNMPNNERLTIILFNCLENHCSPYQYYYTTNMLGSYLLTMNNFTANTQLLKGGTNSNTEPETSSNRFPNKVTMEGLDMILFECFGVGGDVITPTPTAQYTDGQYLVLRRSKIDMKIIASCAIMTKDKSSLYTAYQSKYYNQFLKIKYQNYALIHTVCVSPKFRGLRLCTELIKNLVAHADSISIQGILLTVRNDNYPAIKCYQREGFRPLRDKNTFSALTVNVNGEISFIMERN